MRKAPILILIVFFFSIPAHSYYCYKDKDGVTRCTDDINEVPLEQRKKLQEYEDSQTEEEPEDETKEEEAGTTEATDEPAEDDPDAEFELERLELNKRKKDLKKDYDALVKERDDLTKEKEGIKDIKQMEEYNAKVDALEKKFDSHREKQKKLVKDINDYNLKIEEENTKRREKDKKKE